MAMDNCIIVGWVTPSVYSMLTVWAGDMEVKLKWLEQPSARIVLGDGKHGKKIGVLKNCDSEKLHVFV